MESVIKWQTRKPTESGAYLITTDSEKKELLDAMARNGYCWDEYYKTW